MDALDYRENQGQRNMEFHLANLDALQRESHQTLALLFVLIAATGAGCLRLWMEAKFPALAWALFLVTALWVANSIWVVLGCLWARPVKSPANEPENLVIPEGYTTEEIRAFELKNLQRRIMANAERNEITARHLNHARLVMCLTPLAGAAAWVVAHLAGLS